MFSNISHEGLTLIARAALIASLIVVGAIFRAVVGPGKKRGHVMLAGTLGGITFGVLIAAPVYHWLKTDASVPCACLGMVLGWTVSWRFARQIPREAN